MNEGVRYAAKATFEDGTVKYWCGQPKARYSRRWEKRPIANNRLYLWQRKGCAQNFCDDLPWRAKQEKIIKCEVVEVKMQFD